MTARPIRVLLADDHALLREGLRALLSNDGDLRIVGEATDGLEAVEAALDTGPDVVLMDVTLPSLNGIDATRRITQQRPDIRVLVLTMYDDAQTVDRALRAGAKGYVVKDAGATTVAEAIRAVARGEVYLSPEVSGYVLAGYLNADAPDLDPLTPREREVLQLVAEGYTSHEIAERLGVAVKTVQNQRGRVMEKLGVSTTAALVRAAMRMGLVQ